MKPTRDAITSTIVSTIENITADWSLSADVHADTRLVGELGFTSMDIIDLFAMLDVALKTKLPFEQFAVIEGGGYRQEFTVAELAAFIDEAYDTPRGGLEAV